MADMIVIAEDDDLAGRLVDMLVRLGHHVGRAAEPAELGRVCERPDIVMLQHSDPAGLGGLATQVHELDETGDVPVLAVLDGEGAATFGGGEGIDDFLVFPCTEAELAARLNRLRQKQGPQAEVLQVERLIVDTRSHQVTVDGRLITLTRKEYELLKFLAANRGRVFSRGELFEQVWGSLCSSGRRTVDVHIRRLRAKLGDPYGGWIQTVRQAGYLFSCRPADR